MNELAKLIRSAKLYKAALNVSAPMSSLTTRSAIAANGPQFTTPNEFTMDDQRNLLRWLKGISPSRQRISTARVAGRQSVQRRKP